MSELITESRLCRKCGYELRGLRTGGNCPECGEPVRSRRPAMGVRDGTMTDADPRYVETLRWGFVLMSVAVMASVLAVIVSWFSRVGGDIVSVLAGVGWFFGVVIISRPRPDKFAALEDPVLDSPRMRQLVRVSGTCWPAFALLSAVASAMLASAASNQTPVGLLGGVVVVLAAIVGLAFYLSLIPVCVFVGDMAFWMSDDTGGWRLRAAAWAMTIFGTLSMFGLLLMGIGVGIGGLLFVWCSIVVTIAELVFFWSVIGCISLINWVLRYQDQIEGRAERITERLNDKTTRGGRVAGSTPCRRCGYDLRGLPFGGRCPECGESYADITPLPIIDPAKRAPRDESPIELDETGTPKPIIPARQVFGTRDEDDSPIPLSGYDEPAAPDHDDPDEPDDFQDPAPFPPMAEGPGDDGSIPFDGEDPDDDDRR